MEILAKHIPYALGHNPNKRVTWKRRAVPPEGKIIELDRFEDYLLKPVREGFGLPSLYFVDGAMKLLGNKGQSALSALRQEIPDWDERVERERMTQLVQESPVLAESRRPTRQEQADKGDIGTVTRGSNSAEYLAARLKRDHPEIATQLAKGKFKSVRAAAVAAGIVKLNTHLDVAKRAWGKMAAEEQSQFLEWIANVRH